MKLRSIPAGLLPKLGVAIAVGLLALWGQATHWSIPKPSALFGATPTESKSYDPVKLVRNGSEFPLIVFTAADDARRSGVTVAPTQAQDLDESVMASAVVGYDRGHMAQLAPRAAGRVAYLFRRLGDEVEQGEVLALIDSEEVGRAKADYLQETATCAFKTQVYERLLGSGSDVVSERALREAEAAMREARLRMFAAHQRLVNIGVDVELSADAALTPEQMANRLQFAGIPPEVVATLEPRPRTANLIPLVSPLRGVITQLDTVVGELERPDQPAITVADVSKVWVWLSVRKEDASRLALGQKAELQFDGRSRLVMGRLSWISTEIDPKTRTVQARIDVENPYHQGPAPVTDAASEEEEQDETFSVPPAAASPRELMANMYGSGRVQVSRSLGAILVPDEAVQTVAVGDKPLRSVVFVAAADGLTFEPRVVQRGPSREGHTHIVSGLKPGDRIAVGGSFVLKSELVRESMSGQ